MGYGTCKKDINFFFFILLLNSYLPSLCPKGIKILPSFKDYFFFYTKTKNKKY